MREIKFRAWHKELKEMLNAYIISWQMKAGLKYTDTCRGYYGENEQVKFSLDEIILMQYAGLKDKNGKEIYEGDIVDGEGGRGVISWDNEKVRFAILYDGKIIVGITILGELEIIGNIYKTPELLNSELNVQASVATEDQSSNEADKQNQTT